jgi:hypothetical protein
MVGPSGRFSNFSAFPVIHSCCQQRRTCGETQGFELAISLTPPSYKLHNISNLLAILGATKHCEAILRNAYCSQFVPNWTTRLHTTCGADRNPVHEQRGAMWPEGLRPPFSHGH